jgi:hypothetical protein
VEAVTGATRSCRVVADAIRTCLRTFHRQHPPEALPKKTPQASLEPAPDPPPRSRPPGPLEAALLGLGVGLLLRRRDRSWPLALVLVHPWNGGILAKTLLVWLLARGLLPTIPQEQDHASLRSLATLGLLYLALYPLGFS